MHFFLVYLQCSSVDKRHAVLNYHAKENRFSVKDLSSLNGVSSVTFTIMAISQLLDINSYKFIMMILERQARQLYIKKYILYMYTCICLCRLMIVRQCN